MPRDPAPYQRGDPSAFAIPDLFWRRSDVREALTDRDVGALFRLLNKRCGASQVGIGTRTGMGQPQVWELMNDPNKRVKYLERFEAIARGLCMPDHVRILLGLAPTASGETGSTSDIARDPSAGRCTCSTVGGGGNSCLVHRRDFLAATATIALGFDMSTQGDGPGRIGVADAQRAEQAIQHLLTADDQLGGSDLAASALRQLGQVRWWLQKGNYGPAVGQRLKVASAQLAESAGWLLFDAGQQTEARYFFSEALTAARLAEDEASSTLALASMSLQSTYLGAGREALDLAVAARETATKAAPRVASILAVREARAWARQGDAQRSAETLSRARKDLDRSRPGDGPEWTAFHCDAEIAAAEGSCRADLGDHAGARHALLEALETQNPGYTRNRALYTARLADCALAQRDEEGVLLANRALDLAVQVGSGRVADQISHIRRRMERLPTTDGGGDFAERCDRFLASRRIG